jgi:ribosomal protein S12 methylthiotransferase
MTERVKVVTLGCEKNLVDSEIMSGLIDERGYELVDNKEEATVIIVNTCGFIDAAKEESINTILDLAELKQTANLKALIVSGCLTQRYKEQLLELYSIMVKTDYNVKFSFIWNISKLSLFTFV